MEKMNIGRFFSGHLCYGDTQAPKGETIRRLMAQHHISSACYIGDTQGDMEATYQAGLPFVWAAYGFGDPEKYDYRIGFPLELVDLAKEGLL